MPVLCNICTGYLHEGPMDSTEAMKDGHAAVITLKCGHIFHRFCVERWFNSGSGNGVSGRCPNCENICGLSEALTVFPSYDEDIDAITAHMERMKEAKGNVSVQKEEEGKRSKALKKGAVSRIQVKSNERGASGSTRAAAKPNSTKKSDGEAKREARKNPVAVAPPKRKPAAVATPKRTPASAIPNRTRAGAVAPKKTPAAVATPKRNPVTAATPRRTAAGVATPKRTAAAGATPHPKKRKVAESSAVKANPKKAPTAPTPSTSRARASAEKPGAAILTASKKTPGDAKAPKVKFSSRF